MDTVVPVAFSLDNTAALELFADASDGEIGDDEIVCREEGESLLELAECDKEEELVCFNLRSDGAAEE